MYDFQCYIYVFSLASFSIGVWTVCKNWVYAPDSPMISVVTLNSAMIHVQGSAAGGTVWMGGWLDGNWQVFGG